MLKLRNCFFVKLFTWASIYSLGLMLFQPVRADEVHYNVSIDESFVGVLAINHKFEGIDYEISAQFEAQSFLSAIYDFKIAGIAQGIGVQYGKYTPAHSALGLRRNGKRTVIRLAMEEGMISDRQSEPEIFTELPLALDRFAYDPVTAIGYMVRPQSLDHICALDILVHGGYFEGRLVIGKPALRDDGRYECKGVFKPFGGWEWAGEGQSDIFLSIIMRQTTQSTVELDRMEAQTHLGNIKIWREFRENYYEDTGEIIVVEDILAPTQ